MNEKTIKLGIYQDFSFSIPLGDGVPGDDPGTPI